MAKPSFETYFSQFPARVYKKRWSIVNPGDNLKTIYYLKRGYVRLYSVASDGQELTLIVYKSGEFFPLFVALFPPAPYPYWVETLTAAEIVSVPVELFTSFFKKNPDLLLDLSIEIMKRLDRTLRRMEYLVFGNVTQRLTSLIIMLGERFGRKEKNGVRIEAPFTHQELANLAGITRETASAIMSDLKKRGFVEYKNHTILIKNLTKLTKESLIT